MDKHTLLMIVLNLLDNQRTTAIYTFDKVINILMEVSGYDTLDEFVNDLDEQRSFDKGNPYFKEAVKHLYRQSNF